MTSPQNLKIEQRVTQSSWLIPNSLKSCKHPKHGIIRMTLNSYVPIQTLSKERRRATAHEGLFELQARPQRPSEPRTDPRTFKQRLLNAQSTSHYQPIRRHTHPRRARVQPGPNRREHTRPLHELRRNGQSPAKPRRAGIYARRSGVHD